MIIEQVYPMLITMIIAQRMIRKHVLIIPKYHHNAMFCFPLPWLKPFEKPA